jgi:hypothetical protein
VTYRAAARVDEVERQTLDQLPQLAHYAKIQVLSDCQDGIYQRSRRMVAPRIDGLRYRAPALRPASLQAGVKTQSRLAQLATLLRHSSQRPPMTALRSGRAQMAR